MNYRDTFSIIFGKERTATMNFRFMSKRIWSSRNYIIKWECIGIVIGLIICFSIPKEYMSTVKMVPEKKSIQNFTYISGASLQNFFNSDRDAYTYRLYPLILDSQQFLHDLLSVSVTLSSKDTLETYTIRQLLDKEYKPCWFTIINLFNNQDIDEGTWYNPSKTDYRLIKQLRNNISLFVMDRTGHLELQVKMQNAVAAAVLADTIAARIEKFVADYRNNKDLQRYRFVEHIFEESKEIYENTNLQYAQYLDSNNNLSKNSDRIDLFRLKMNKDISKENYRLNSIILLSEQFKQALYSPVYHIIEPPTIAIKSTYPRKLVILSYCMFFFGYIPLLKSIFKRV